MKNATHPSQVFYKVIAYILTLLFIAVGGGGRLKYSSLRKKPKNVSFFSAYKNYTFPENVRPIALLVLE